MLESNDTAQSFWLENLKSASHYNRWIFSQILPHLGQAILEIGCGNGNFTELLAQQDSDLTAIDLNEKFVDATMNRLRGKSGIKVLVADATQITWTTSQSVFEEKSFDTIILLDVLEHIAADIQLLQHLSHGLRSGGKLIVKVPALNWLYSPMDQAIGHHRRYNKHSLIETFKQAGLADPTFADPIVWYFNTVGIPGWWLNGRLLQRTTPPAEQIGWFDRAVPMLATIESGVSMPIGLSLFAVATKI